MTIPNSSIRREPAPRSRYLEVECNDGWMTAKNQTIFSIRCATNLFWRGLQPCDQPRSCGDIPVVTGALHNGTTTRVGAQVRYLCAERGTFLKGNDTIVCRDDARWSPVPQCDYQMKRY